LLTDSAHTLPFSGQGVFDFSALPEFFDDDDSPIEYPMNVDDRELYVGSIEIYLLITPPLTMDSKKSFMGLQRGFLSKASQMDEKEMHEGSPDPDETAKKDVKDEKKRAKKKKKEKKNETKNNVPLSPSAAAFKAMAEVFPGESVVCMSDSDPRNVKFFDLPVSDSKSPRRASMESMQTVPADALIASSSSGRHDGPELARDIPKFISDWMARESAE
jgi:hypothetical protein